MWRIKVFDFEYSHSSSKKWKEGSTAHPNFFFFNKLHNGAHSATFVPAEEWEEKLIYKDMVKCSWTKQINHTELSVHTKFLVDL